jgi:hypothetical protein
MSNFLRGFGRTVGLTDDEVGDDNASRASSYVEVNYLQGANTQGRAPRNAEGEQMSQQGGGGISNSSIPKPKGPLGAGTLCTCPRLGAGPQKGRVDSATTRGGGTTRGPSREGHAGSSADRRQQRQTNDPKSP